MCDGQPGFKTEELNLDANLVDITSQPGGTIRLRAKDAALAVNRGAAQLAGR